MPTKRKQASVRKPRSDAQRNRERILEVAKEAFTRSGANTSLDDIARDAGVGPGTLYRHFPAREELLEAVYRTEMEKLASAEQKFAEELPPIEALRAWLLLFVDYIAAKQLIAPALNALVGDPKKVFEASYARIHEALRALVKRAIKSGDIRGPRSDRPAAGADRCRQRGHQPGLAAERQKTRRHPHHRFTSSQIVGLGRRAIREFGQPPKRAVA